MEDNNKIDNLKGSRKNYFIISRTIIGMGQTLLSFICNIGGGGRNKFVKIRFRLFKTKSSGATKLEGEDRSEALRNNFSASRRHSVSIIMMHSVHQLRQSHEK